MSISYITKGTDPTGAGTGTGTTSVTADIPAHNEYDFMVLVVGTDGSGHTISATTAGWNQLNGGGEGGLAQNIKTFYRVADGTETSVTAGISTGTGSWGQVFIYRSSNAMPFWAWESTTGTDSTVTGTTFSAASATNIDIEANAFVLVSVNNVAGNVLYSACAVSATSATLGTGTIRSQPAVGTACSGVHYDKFCSAGISTAGPLATATTDSGFSSGVACITRLDDAPDVTDNFTRADSTTALGRTEGTGWFPWGNLHAGANLGISTNRAYSPTGSGRAFLQPGRYDKTSYQATVVAGNTSNHFISFRVQADSDWWRFGYDSSLGAIALQSFDSSVLTTTVNTGIAAALNDVYRVELDGDDIRCYVNGTLRASTTSSVRNTNASCGLDLLNATPMLDSYSVRNAVSPKPEQPAATAAASNATAAVAPAAQASAVTAAALNATVTISSGTVVNAESPSATSAASSATVDVKANTGQSVVTAAGLDATVNVTGSTNAAADDGVVAAASQDAKATVATTATAAAATAAANNATVTAGTNGVSVDAECAEATAQSYDVADWPQDSVPNRAFPSRRRIKGKWTVIRGVSPLSGGQDL